MLQELRLKKGLSQSKFAAAAGVSVKNIQAYESGLRSIEGAKFDTIITFCNVLECNMKDLITNKDTIEKLEKYENRIKS